MAKLVFGMSQSLDGYVDDAESTICMPPPGPAVFRHFIEVVAGHAGCIYGRRIYEVMRYWDVDRPLTADRGQRGHGQRGHGQGGHGQGGHGQRGHGQRGHGQRGHGQVAGKNHRPRHRQPRPWQDDQLSDTADARRPGFGTGGRLTE